MERNIEKTSEYLSEYSHTNRETYQEC